MKKSILLFSSALLVASASAEYSKFTAVDLPMVKSYKASEEEISTEVGFRIPEGTFYFGDNGDHYIMPGSVLLPPYSTVTWTYDGDEAASYKWEYPDMSQFYLTPEQFVWIESSDKDLTYQTTSYNIGRTPKLTATFADGTEKQYMITGNYDDTPSYIQVGGRPADFYYNNMPGLYYVDSFGMSIYSFKYGTAVLNTDFAQKSYVFGNGEEVTNEGITGLATIFPEPAAPYIIDKGVRGMLYFLLDDDAEITMTLRKATKVNNKEYTLGAEIGHATMSGATLKSAANLIGDDVYWGHILFDKLYKTDADGNEVEVTPVIDTAMAVVFTGWDTPHVTKFAVFSNEQIYTNGKYDEKANARIGSHAMWTGGTYGNSAKVRYENIAPAITLNAYFPYVYCEDKTFDAPKEGTVRTLTVDQYNYYANLSFECDGVAKPEATASAGQVALNDWISVNYTKDISVHQFNNNIDIIVAPNEGESRSAVVSFVDIDGTKFDLTVTQSGNSGINDIIGGEAKVFVTTGEIIIENSSASKAAVYNTTGCKVLEADATEAISIEHLQAGVYILALDNGYKTKFIKK